MAHESRVIVAFSYDTEMAAPEVLPTRVLSRDAYAILSLEEKKNIWVRYLGDGLWSDQNQFAWSRCHVRDKNFLK